MEPEHGTRVLHSVRHFVHRQGGGVRGQHRTAGRGFHFPQDLLLHGHPLDDRLNHEIDSLDVSVIEGARDEGEFQRRLLLTEDPSGRCLSQKVARMSKSRIEGILVDILENDRDVVCGG